MLAWRASGGHTFLVAYPPEMTILPLYLCATRSFAASPAGPPRAHPNWSTTTSSSSTLSLSLSHRAPGENKPKEEESSEGAASPRDLGLSGRERGVSKMHDFCFTIPYGFAVLAGGVLGYLRRGSTASLAGGAGAGALLLLAGFVSLKAFEKRRNSYLALALETRTHRPLPAPFTLRCAFRFLFASHHFCDRILE